jgi:TPR repeat protein
MRLVSSGLAFCLVLAGAPARADFAQAVKQYAAGDYLPARYEFLGLASLGDAASQYNLAAMAQQGQAGPQNVGASIGWLLAAAENGYQRVPTERLAAARARLTPDQQREAQQILDHYGREALLKTVLPGPDESWSCPPASVAVVKRIPGLVDGFIDVPGSGSPAPRPGIVVVEATIDRQGRARDPEVLLSLPTRDPEPAAIATLLKSEFTPASVNGAAVESRLTIAFRFRKSSRGASWADAGYVEKLRANERDGDPGAQYAIGIAGGLDDAIGVTVQDADQVLIKVAQGGHGLAQYRVGRRFESLSECGQDTKKMPWFNQAVAEGDEGAQLALAEQVLRENPSVERLGRARNLLDSAALSERFYVRKHAAALLAASSTEALRDPRTALVAADKLLKGPIQSDPQMFEVAAAAHASNGQFERAATLQDAAIGKARALQWKTNLMEERLSAYRAGKTWLGDLFAQPPE